MDTQNGVEVCNTFRLRCIGCKAADGKHVATVRRSSMGITPYTIPNFATLPRNFRFTRWKYPLRTCSGDGEGGHKLLGLRLHSRLHRGVADIIENISNPSTYSRSLALFHATCRD